MSSPLKKALETLSKLGISEEEAEAVMRRVIATQDALRKHKEADWNLYLRACHSMEPKAIGLFSEWLLKESKKHADEWAPARRGVALPMSVINDCASLMLRWSVYNDTIPSSLLFLLEHQLGADKEGGNVDRRYIKRQRAAAYLAAYPDASDSEVAKEVGVTRSTVWRWRTNDKFKADLVREQHNLQRP
jgi:hypothetical protein